MCIFCKISKGDIPSYKVYEDDKYLAFLDISQTTKGHTLLIPKKHFENLLELDTTEYNNMFDIVKKIAKGIKDETNAKGFNILNNCNEAAGQTVMHFHIHIIPRRSNDNVDAWPKFDGANCEIEEIYKIAKANRRKPKKS